MVCTEQPDVSKVTVLPARFAGTRSGFGVTVRLAGTRSGFGVTARLAGTRSGAAVAIGAVASRTAAADAQPIAVINRTRAATATTLTRLPRKAHRP